MFKKFPSLTRFSHDWTITEKIDGSNGQIIIDNLSSSDDAMYRDKALAQIGEYYIFAGSRNKLLGLGKDNDNFGLAQWVQNNAPVLVETLGEGRHYGEWCGNGIQRNYGLSKKLFALFNTHRWGGGVELPESIGLTVVPVLAEGYMQDPGKEAAELFF